MLKMYIVSSNINFICKTISADYNGFEERYWNWLRVS